VLIRSGDFILEYSSIIYLCICFYIQLLIRFDYLEITTVLEIYLDVIKFADLDSCLISATVLHHASPQGVSLVCSDQAGDS